MHKEGIYSMYFIAIVCPDSTQQKLLNYKQWMLRQFNCKVALKSPAHITLVPPFYFSEEKEQQLLQTFNHFMWLPKSVSIRLNDFSHFGKRVIYVQVNKQAALEELRRALINYFNVQWPGIIKVEQKPFHPHITIANRDVTPSIFLKAWEYFSRQHYADVFDARTISLLKLIQGQWQILAQKEWSSGNYS
jgi:2'-5' RNA ligase